MIVTPKLRHWLALVALTILWGSAYVLIKVSLRSFTPVTLTALRLILAALALYLIMRIFRMRLPTDWTSWRYFLMVSAVGNCLPFFLVSYGQDQLDTGLTGLLLATTPLFVLLLAHFMLPDEPMRRGRSVGFGLGFVGVALLIGPDAVRALSGDLKTIGGQLAILSAALCYALSAIIVRHGPRHHVLIYSTAVMLIGSAVLVPAAIVFGGESVNDFREAGLQIWLSVLVLGVVTTGLSALVFFYIVDAAGAGFQSLSNFLIPPWAIVLGWLVLDERLPARAYVALPIILAGLYVVQRVRQPAN